MNYIHVLIFKKTQVYQQAKKNLTEKNLVNMKEILKLHKIHSILPYHTSRMFRKNKKVAVIKMMVSGYF